MVGFGESLILFGGYMSKFLREYSTSLVEDIVSSCMNGKENKIARLVASFEERVVKRKRSFDSTFWERFAGFSNPARETFLISDILKRKRNKSLCLAEIVSNEALSLLEGGGDRSLFVVLKESLIQKYGSVYENVVLCVNARITLSLATIARKDAVFLEGAASAIEIFGSEVCSEGLTEDVLQKILNHIDDMIEVEFSIMREHLNPS
jgi:hypothetical protein